MITAADQREATAYHEAGHGVLDVVTGQRFRYITLRPRDRSRAGHVMVYPTTRLGWWDSEVASAFAGMIAEDMWWTKAGPPTDTETRRRTIIQVSGRSDMVCARDLTRAAWEDQSSYSVRQMAEAAWRHAVRTTVERWEAVAALAELLLTQSRAVTWAQAIEAIVEHRLTEMPDSAEAQSELLHPWFLDHSLLSWEPKPEIIRLTSPPVAARGNDA